MKVFRTALSIKIFFDKHTKAIFTLAILLLLLRLLLMTQVSSEAVDPMTCKAIQVASRSVSKYIFAREQAEGVGARVHRTIGRPELRSFDPFLMLDEFKVGRPGGFPSHPHRGFQTVTYLLDSSEGSIVHEDFVGHKGQIDAGDLQWMHAGRGVVHSEMPLDDTIAHGLQLWVNLPKEQKMTAPDYQELLAKDVPKATLNGVTATIISGKAFGVTSPVLTRTPVHYLHFKMEANSKLEQPIEPTFQSFLYSLSGTGTVGSQVIEPHHVVTLDQNGSGIIVETGNTDGFSFVLVSGEPIKEPVVQHGPFVMNTNEEIMQAMEDYQSQKNGFENALAFKATSEK